MGGARSEVHDGTTRVLHRGRDLERPEHQPHLVRAGAAQRGLARASRRASRPSRRWRRRRSPSRLMIELCGATLVAGHDRRRRPRPGARVVRLRDARVDALLGAPVARERSAEILRALGFGVAEAGDGLDVTVPPFRRTDVTREADLIEEVARIDGFEGLPATIQENRTGAPGHLTPRAAAAAPRRGRARRPRAARGRRLVVHRPAAARPPAPARGDRLRERRALENPMSEAQSILRPTILGVAARHRRAQRRARRWATSRSSSPAPSTNPAATVRSRPSTTRSAGAAAPGALAPRVVGGGASPPPPTSSPPRPRRGGLRGPARRAVRRARGPAPGRSCTRAAPPRSLAGGERRSAGSASCTRSSPRAWDLGDAGRRLRARPRPARRHGARRVGLRRPHELPGGAPGPRGRRRRRRRRPRASSSSSARRAAPSWSP